MVRQKRIELNAMDSTINHVVENGGVLVGSERIGRADYICIDEGGNANLLTAVTDFADMVGDGSPTRAYESAGLKVAGVTRRRGILRHFIEIPTDEIQCGDRVVLEDDEGTRYKIPKINTLKQPA